MVLVLGLASPQAQAQVPEQELELELEPGGTRTPLGCPRMSSGELANQHPSE